VGANHRGNFGSGPKDATVDTERPEANMNSQERQDFIKCATG
jgi:hypothetical protein